MKILNLTDTNHQQIMAETQKVLARGGLVIFPTETTYGAGVDATQAAAVQKLLSYKSRREGKPLSIAVTDLKMAEKFVELNDSARRLYQRFLPGPVTVVSRGLGKVAAGVESEFGTLGVRIPDHQFVLELLKNFGKPMTATSANASGGKRPYTVDDIFQGLSEKQKNLIDLVIDAGRLPSNPPSTVIDTTLSTPVVMRSGILSKSEKELSQKNTQTLISESESETRSLAGRILLKHWNTVGDRGLIIGLDGALGVGKTIFAKGAADFLQITDDLTSPTYTYIEEYDYQRQTAQGQFFHLDVWKIDSLAQFKRLEFEKLLKPGNVIVVEWWQQVAEFVDKGFPQISILIEDFDGEGLKRQLQIQEKI